MDIFEQNRERESAVPLLPLIVGDDNGVFYYENETNPKDRAIASCCVFSPLSGISPANIKALQNMLDTEIPTGTIMQFIQLGSPNLDRELSLYTNVRNSNISGRLNAMSGSHIDHSAISSAQYAVHNRAEFLKYGSKHPLLDNQNTVLTETLCFFTIKVPVKTQNPFNGNEAEDRAFCREVDEFVKLRSQLLSSLEVVGIKAQVMMHSNVLALIRKYLDMSGAWDDAYDPDEILNRQIFPPGSSISWGGKGHNTIHFKGFSFENKRQNVGMLVIDRYPNAKKPFSIYRMLEMLGKTSGQGTQFGCPYALTTMIHFPNQDSKKAKFRGSQVVTSKQSKNATMMEFSERLKRKKIGFATMAKAIDDGGNIVEATTTLTLFNASKNELDKTLSRFASYYQTLGFVMRRETFIPAVSFFNNLPMNASVFSIHKTERFKTMMSSHAAHLLPILDEWCGIENFAKDGTHLGNEMVLTTRLGRLFSYSLFSDTNNNYNWTMIAGAGSGKSFFTQRLTQDHLSLGTKIWTIDTGSSYLAAARAAGAQIIDFGFESQVCLNPFTKIQKFDEEIELIIPIIAKMAKPKEGINDIERSILTEAIRSTFQRRGNDANLDDVIAFLNNQQGDHATIQNQLGLLLSEFGSTGSMGRWFNGKNNFEAEADWTVLELSGLTTNKHLCDVVLMMISTTISQEMFTKRDGRKKMLIIEEGGDRITDSSFAEFTAKLYAKVRKEFGSVGVVTQSFNQIHATPFGKTIMDNAWTQFYMQQSPESIQSALDNHWLEDNGYIKHLLHECRTEKGRFSEVIIRSGQSAGIARLIETPFNRVLFSTEGEFFHHIQSQVRQGHQISELVMEEAKRRYPNDFQAG